MITIKEELNAKDIGNRMKSKLKELNLKQTDLVNITGISKTAISNYILGNRIPDTNSIYLISNILNVSIEWLLIGKDNITLSERENNILKQFNKLNEDNKKYIETYTQIRLENQEQEINDTNENLA